MTKLNPAQAVALTETREKSDEYRTARARLQAELKVRLEAELDALRGQRDRAAFRAFQLGVPKRRIGLEALGTTDPKTPAEVVEAGRVLVGGTLDDPKVSAALIANATPVEPIWLHPRDGKPFADNQPFTLGDAPRTLTLTAGVAMEGVTKERRTVLYSVAENGIVAPVNPDDAGLPMTLLFQSPTPVGRALREAALDFVNASAS